MTKLKSKKMTKSTFAVIIMAILMVAMLAFGGTYAYFTATTQKDQTDITLGYLKLKDNDAFANIVLENAFPGQQILPAGKYASGEDEAEGIILTINTSDRKGNYVAVRFDFQIILNDDADLETDDVLDDGVDDPDNRTRLNQSVIDQYIADVGLTKDDPATEGDQSDMVPDGVYNKAENPTATKPNYENKTPADIFEIVDDERVAMKDGYEYDDNAKPDDKDYSETLHKKCQYIQLFNDLRADNIKNKSNEDNVIGAYEDDTDKVTAVGAYYWNNFNADENIYFLTNKSAGGNETLQAIGATAQEKRDDDKDAWDNYYSEVELIVNHDEFRLDIEINDNWSEREEGDEGEDQESFYEDLPDLGIQGAVIEIVLTAASVQATGNQTLPGEDGQLNTDDDIVEVIDRDHAEAQLVALLPGWNFEDGKMNNVKTPVFSD